MLIHLADNTYVLDICWWVRFSRLDYRRICTEYKHIPEDARCFSEIVPELSQAGSYAVVLADCSHTVKSFEFGKCGSGSPAMPEMSGLGDKARHASGSVPEAVSWKFRK